MKKSIPIKYLHHDNQEIETGMQKKVCGIMCVAMILTTHKKDFGTIQGLICQAKELDAYIPGIGWDHRGLVKVLKKYEVEGERFDIKGLENKPQKIKEYLDQNKVLIASVGKGFSDNLTSTHLVVIHGYECDQEGKVSLWFVSDPSSLREEQEEVEVEYFERYFRGLGVKVSIE